MGIGYAHNSKPGCNTSSFLGCRGLGLTKRCSNVFPRNVSERKDWTSFLPNTAPILIIIVIGIFFLLVFNIIVVVIISIFIIITFIIPVVVVFIIDSVVVACWYPT